MLSECSDYVVSTRHKIHIRVEYNVFPVVCIQQHIDYIHSASVGNDAFHVLKIKLVTIMTAHIWSFVPSPQDEHRSSGPRPLKLCLDQ